MNRAENFQNKNEKTWARRPRYEKEWIPACAGMTKKEKQKFVPFVFNSCHSCSAVFAFTDN